VHRGADATNFSARDPTVTRLASLAASLFVVLSLGASSACGSGAATESGEAPREAAPAAAVSEAEVVRPPFAVRGELEGLLLVWFDEEGPHPAQRRADVPEAHRQYVRVDSLAVAPDDRLDPAFVYLADLRAPGADGSYVVRRVARDSFEALLAEARGAAAAAIAQAGDANADVVVYGASWCGACRQAEAYLRARGVPFVEKDVERDPGAQEEMMRKATAQGLRPTGIPVIDVRGRILLGFDRGAIDRLLAQAPARPAAPPAAPPAAAPPAAAPVVPAPAAPPAAAPAGSGGQAI
jgi:glutaredoxin